LHIPDGYLSPATCLVFYGSMAPLWFKGARKVEGEFHTQGLSRLSLASAFVFVIMMFNFPLPGGTSGHLVGAAILAITLGPWAAFISISLVIFLQALIFGDGGVTAIGANAFNMAFIMSFVSYGVFKIFSFGESGRGRLFLASALAGYVSVIIAALAVALELGIQPLVAMDAMGRPLYAPYSLGITLPAVVIPHMLFFGPVEALGTALVLGSLHRRGHEPMPSASRGGTRPLWWGLSALVVMTPLGLVSTGVPWGEWSPKVFSELFGFIPAGMARLGQSWGGLLPGYGISGMAANIAGKHGAMGSALVYILSAALGSLALVFLVYIWGRLWRRGS